MGKVVAVKVRGRDFMTALKKSFAVLGKNGFLQSLLKKEKLISLKVNALAGKKLSTSPELALALAEILSLELSKDVIIWDRTERELKKSGFSIKKRGSIKIIATDTPRVGYYEELIQHKNIGSLFSRIQMACDASISIAVAKDHDLSGVSLSMKNYYGAIHNPNKYHDFGCNPFIPELFESPPILEKHRLSIIDVTRMQYHRGPSFHPKWFKNLGLIVISEDPVAADAFVWKLIEKEREKAGLPSLKAEGRHPEWIFEAQRMGLGKAEKFEVVEL